MDNYKNIEYEREVISIPASKTIDLIYKYEIHAHPNNYDGYSYKKSLYYTFRSAGGYMKSLFSLDRIIDLNPSIPEEINNFKLDYDIKKRLVGYINDRANSLKFSPNVEYKFYIFAESIELPKVVRLPRQNNQAYFTLSEIYSGKEIIEKTHENIHINNEEN